MMQGGLSYIIDQLLDGCLFKYIVRLLSSPQRRVLFGKTFEGYIPSWVQRKPRVETHWNAILQVLEGHTNAVSSVAFSPDGKKIVSRSRDRTVRR